MTSKSEIFKAALQALCVELGIHVRGDEDYEYLGTVYIEEATDEKPAGTDLRFYSYIPLSPEEQARKDAADAEVRALEARRREVLRVEEEERCRATFETPAYLHLLTTIEAHAAEERKKHMRVTRIPGDHNNIGDKPCRVYLNEVEVTDWIVADDFRRVVETPSGAKFGSVRIDMAPESSAVEPEVATHLCGVFVAVPKPAASAIEVVEAAEPAPEPAKPSFAAPKVAVKAAAPRKKRSR